MSDKIEFYMNVTLTLNDRLYTDIENLLKASDIKINDYLVGAIEDKFYTDKYGDLNEVLYKKEETIKEEPVKKEKEVSRKVVKKVASKVIEDKKEETIKEEVPVKEEVQDKTTEKIKKRVTRTRTIKSK